MTPNTADPIDTNPPKKVWETVPLAQDEVLLWQGEPGRGLQSSPLGWLRTFIGFVLIFLALLVSSIATDVPVHAYPIVFLFVVFGSYNLVGHWFYDAFDRSRARYALTNQRAIIKRNVWKEDIQSYSIGVTSPIIFTSSDPRHVFFAEKPWSDADGNYVKKIGFQYIEEGRKVYNIIQDILREKSWP